MIRAPQGGTNPDLVRRALEGAGVAPKLAAEHARLLQAGSEEREKPAGDFGFDEAISRLPAHTSRFGRFTIRWTIDVFDPDKSGVQLRDGDAGHDYLVALFAPSSLACRQDEDLEPALVAGVLRRIIAPICSTVGSDFGFGTATHLLNDVLACIQLHSFPYSLSYVPLTRYLWGWAFYSAERAEDLGITEEQMQLAGMAHEHLDDHSLLLWRVGVQAPGHVDSTGQDPWDWYSQAGILGLRYPGHVEMPMGFQCCPGQDVDPDVADPPLARCALSDVIHTGSDTLEGVALRDTRQVGILTSSGVHSFAGPGRDELAVFQNGQPLHAHALQPGSACRVLLSHGMLGGHWALDQGLLVAEIECGDRTQLVLKRVQDAVVEVLRGEDLMSYDGSLRNEQAELWCCRPRLAPDGSGVVFTSPRLELPDDELVACWRGVDILLADPSTHVTRLLVASPMDEAFLEPVWSADSSRVAYLHYARERTRWTRCWLVVCDLEGGTLLRHALPGPAYSMDWAPSPDRVVMALTDTVELFYGDMNSWRGGRLAVLDLAQGHLEYLSADLDSLSDCFWMPDSERIAFTCARPGSDEQGLYVGRYCSPGAVDGTGRAW